MATSRVGVTRPAAPPCNPQTGDILRELDIATDRARTLVGSIDRRALVGIPAPGQWSAAQCLIHLGLTSDGYDSTIRQAIADARQAGRTRSGPFRADLVGRVLAWSLEPPARIRTKTAAIAEPGDGIPPERAFPIFLAAQERLRDRVVESDGVALDRLMVTSLFNARIRYNLLSYFRVTLAHERRHLWQAARAAAMVNETL